MAVYTRITNQELVDFLDDYALGRLDSFDGIEKGVSNTNYSVKTNRGRYILTIFEERRTRKEDLPYLFAYAAHLAANGIACPQVLLDNEGIAIKELRGKPAALVSFLEGEDIPRGFANADQCGQVGTFVARMHKASESFTMHRDIDWSLQIFREKAVQVEKDLRGNRGDLVELIYKELDYLDQNYPTDKLSEGACHLDLFPDNMFFRNGRLSAMIDMYFASNESYVYDLAIVVNAWCFDSKGHFNRRDFEALMKGYESIRPLEPIERESFQVAQRAACMRFIVSRMEELLAFKPDQTMMVPHDPNEFVKRLQFHQEHDILNG